MRGRLTSSNFQTNASTSVSLPIRWVSPRLNTRVIARQAQESLERSSQITRVARGNRISKVASAKLPSLIHSSPACAVFNKVRKTEMSFSSQCGCQMASRQMTGAPVRLASCRAKVVFPLPAQPKMTIRSIIPFHAQADCCAAGILPRGCASREISVDKSETIATCKILFFSRGSGLNRVVRRRADCKSRMLSSARRLNLLGFLSGTLLAQIYCSADNLLPRDYSACPQARPGYLNRWLPTRGPHS
jgi:hypothetical protein